MTINFRNANAGLSFLLGFGGFNRGLNSGDQPISIQVMDANELRSVTQWVVLRKNNETFFVDGNANCIALRDVKNEITHDVNSFLKHGIKKERVFDDGGDYDR